MPAKHRRHKQDCRRTACALPSIALGLRTCCSINRHVLDEATGHNAHAKVRVYDALQLSQDLGLQGLHMGLQADSDTAYQAADIAEMALKLGEAARPVGWQQYA